jgi:hypothetical protein
MLGKFLPGDEMELHRSQRDKCAKSNGALNGALMNSRKDSHTAIAFKPRTGDRRATGITAFLTIHVKPGEIG